MNDNRIVIENQKAGTDKAIWDAPTSSQIEGFATDISVDQGETVSFKINIDTPIGVDVPYHVEIYRLGYYGGDGATLVTTLAGLTGSAQPAPVTDGRGVVDAGNWAISASWTPPVDATSGVYLARLVREDNGESNQIPFIVREDNLRVDGTRSDIVIQTSDTTWQAYNGWSGNNGQIGGNLYGDAGLGLPPLPDASPLGSDRAFGVSYNRPIITRDATSFASGPQDYLFGADFAAIYFLEQQGYDVSYISGVDTDRLGPAALLGHKAFISLGHDEYWSGDQRANVEQARDAGVNLLFWGGNDIYWKSRYEPSIDGTATDYRTLISYKETWANYSLTATAADYANLDPSDQWTGTWRDVRFVDAVDAAGNPIAQGARPENSLTGQLFIGDSYAENVGIDVPAALSGLRVWRDTTVANGGAVDMSPGIIGYEWNTVPVDESRPNGIVLLSDTLVDWPKLLTDQGSRAEAGTAPHSLSIYRAPSGALVFSAGTVFWSWGLSDQHDSIPYGGNIKNVALQQFTINLFADMGIQPAISDAILASQGLVRATESTDTVSATATLDNIPDTIFAQQTYLLTGTATDDDGNALTADGQVALVEVSFDNGVTWRPATGYSSWSYEWTPTAVGDVTVSVRAIDDSLNLPDGTLLSNDTVSVIQPPPPPFSTLFDGTTAPMTAYNDGASLELGVRFTPAAAGLITELHYFRGANDSSDTDQRDGHLWSADGTLLATTTFTSAPGESGWQTAALATPVIVYAGQTYTVSYHTEDNYVATNAYFLNDIANASGQLSAPGTGNGVYAYSGSVVLPTSSYGGANYWVDVTYGPGLPPNDAPVFTSGTAFSVSENQTSAAVFTASDANGDPLVYAIAGGADAALFTINSQTGALAFLTAPDFEAPADTDANNIYDVIVSVTDQIAAPATAAVQITVTDQEPEVIQIPTRSLFDGISVSAPVGSDGAALELGVRIIPTQSGTATELMYYRAVGDAGDTDVRDGHLWNAAGVLIGTVTFTSAPGETGWQTAAFDSPVNLVAGQSYTVSYRTLDNYIATQNYFAQSHTDSSGLLTAPAGGNGVYVYGSTLVQPTSSYNASNYWVDLAFVADPPPTPSAAPVITSADTFILSENTRAVGTVTATDADGDTLRFALAGGADSSLFRLDHTTGDLTFIFAPDFENPADAGGNNIYDIIVGVSDGTGPAVTQSMQITVGDVTGTGDVNANATLFTASDTPALTETNDPTTYELGVRFTAAEAGSVNELRYYRGAQDATDTDVRTLNLWDANGILLTTASVQSDPGDTGWQIATLNAPVALTAGATYVASYGTTQNYAATNNFFATAHTGPDSILSALAGGNGVYAAGSTGLFPTQSYQNSNYWVDVNFVPDSAVAASAPAPDAFIFDVAPMTFEADPLLM